MFVVHSYAAWMYAFFSIVIASFDEMIHSFIIFAELIWFWWISVEQIWKSHKSMVVECVYVYCAYCMYQRFLNQNNMNLIFIVMHLQRAYVFVLAFFLKIENGKRFPVLNIQMRGKSLTCGYFVIGLSTSYIKPYKEKNKFFDNVHHTPKLQFFSLVLVID